MTEHECIQALKAITTRVETNNIIQIFHLVLGFLEGQGYTALVAAVHEALSYSGYHHGSFGQRR